MPTRRNLLVSLGALLAGGGAALGTGAFTTVQAERTVSVETSGDATAFLGLTPGVEGDEYVDNSQDGAIEIDISTTSAGGQGVNQNAVTAVDQLIEVTNNGTNAVAVGFSADYAEQRGDFSKSKYERPYGWTYATTDESDAAVVLWASPMEAEMDKTYREIRPELTTTGFTGSTLVDGRYIDDEVGETRPDDGEARRVIDPGDRLNIGIVVDTRESTVVDEPIPNDLDTSITIVAESE